MLCMTKRDFIATPSLKNLCNSAAVSPLMLHSGSFCLEARYFSEFVCMLFLGCVVEKITSQNNQSAPRDLRRPYLGGQLPLISGIVAKEIEEPRTLADAAAPL